MENTNWPQQHKHKHRLNGQAVIIGSGVTGLVAAQALASVFAEVTVIDRDLHTGQPNFRPGAPQANHAHTLLPLGLHLMERQFPGLRDELIAAGAILVDEERDTFQFTATGVEKPRVVQQRSQISASRPLLESILYRRVSRRPGVKFVTGMDATDLQIDQHNRKATGVHLRSRTGPREMLVLPAELVVDASGRNSRAPQWLEQLGFIPPEEWHIDTHAGYSSRIYRQPSGFDGEWKRMYIHPQPPRGTRGGVILPLESERWHVTLIGIDRDYPPLDESGFLAFAASLPVPDLYNAIKQAAPLSPPAGYRNVENRVRRYENLPIYLDGFLVTGDAVFTMNPVYALGMTAAAVNGLTLRRALEAWEDMSALDGLAAYFQKQLAKDILALWRQAVENEWRWDNTEITDNTDEIDARMRQLEGV